MTSIKELIEACRSRELHVFLPRMSVRRGGGASVATGAGTIRTAKDGGFDLTMHIEGQSASLGSMLLQKSREGRFVPESELCSVVGTDTAGREWSVEREIPRELSYSSTLSGFSTVLFKPSIVAIKDLPRIGDADPKVLVYFAPVLNLPFRVSGNTKQFREGELIAVRYDLPFESLEHEGIALRVVQQDGLTAVRFRIDSEVLPLSVGQAIEDAFTWLLGKRQHYAAIRCGETTWITASHARETAELWSIPLRWRRDPRTYGDWWNLLLRLIRFLLFSEKADHIQRLIRRNESAGRASPESHASVVALAVEMLVGLLKPASAPSVPPIAEEWRAALEARSDVPKADKVRLGGLLDQLRVPRVRDQLEKLVEDGVVALTHPVAWKKLRNTVLHPKAQDISDEDWIALMEPAIACMHRLMFSMLGYAGGFTDYGLEDYPLDRFDVPGMNVSLDG